MSVLTGMKPHTSDKFSGGRSSIVQISGWKGAESGWSGGQWAAVLEKSNNPALDALICVC